MTHEAIRPGRTTWLTDPGIPFSRNVPLHTIIGLFILFWVYMAISPTSRMQWLVSQSILIAVILALGFTYRWFRFSNLSYLLMFLFFCLHTYASHYTYEGTPFDLWLKSSFHTTRSYYDRVVHFAFGLLLVYPFRELLTRIANQRGFWPYAIPVAIVLSLSAGFEIIEMLAALVYGPGGEEKFVGMQGDVYDTQKDMMLGFLGGLVATGITAWVEWSKEKKLELASGQ